MLIWIASVPYAYVCYSQPKIVSDSSFAEAGPQNRLANRSRVQKGILISPPQKLDVATYSDKPNLGNE